MLNTLIWIAVFIASLSVLIKASDYFTSSAEKLGVFFGIPSFIIGATIVAFGTSLPELVTSVAAVLKNSSEIVAGNVIGSNIANIFLVLGLVAVTNRRIKIHFNIIHIDLPFLIGSSLLLALSIWVLTASFSSICFYYLNTIKNLSLESSLTVGPALRFIISREYETRNLTVLLRGMHLKESNENIMKLTVYEKELSEL